jgi:polyferredoxin
MPGDVNLTKTFFLISGILNGIFGISWIVYTIIFGLFTCGIGCLFGFLPVINFLTCVLDIIAYSRLNNLDRAGTFNSIQFASIFDIVTFITGNPASGIFGIINIINMNKPEFKNFLVEKGIY